jgi:hypothetical protein
VKPIQIEKVYHMMNPLKILGAFALAHIATLAASAQTPTGIGDSFLTFTYTNGSTITGSGLFYFGTDGTCRKFALSTTTGPTGAPSTTYDASQSGTYTYTPSASNTNQAAVAVTMDGSGTITGYFFSVDFGTGTSGTLDFSPQGQFGPLIFYTGNFSLLLHTPNTFLANVSNRVTLRPSETAITGFVIQGGGSRLVLVRTVGPSLAQFGVSPVSQNPQLNLFQGTGTSQIASGAVWGSGAFSTGGYDPQAMSWIFAMVGAFSLQANSNDVAFFGVLSPGVYTAQSSDATAPAGGGSALTEVYILPYSG